MSKISKAPPPINPIRSFYSTKQVKEAVTTMGEPNWEYWTGSRKVAREEAVALSMNIDPDSIRQDAPYKNWNIEIIPNQTTRDEFKKRFELIEGHFSQTNIPLSKFSDWARTVSLEVPSQILALADSSNKITATLKYKWPWGDYDTNLLRLLAAAAKKFWILYDPNDPSTAPIKSDVVAWLKEQKLPDGKNVSGSAAEAIATILRADNLRTGPR